MIAVSKTILFVAVVVLKQQKSTAVPFLLCCIVLLCICRHANWRRKTNRFIEEVWSAVKAVPNREEVEKNSTVTKHKFPLREHLPGSKTHRLVRGILCEAGQAEGKDWTGGPFDF